MKAVIPSEARNLLLRSRSLVAALLGMTSLACSTRSPNRTGTELPDDRAYGDRIVRVAVPVSAPIVAASRGFQWYAADGHTLLTTSRGRDAWRIERDDQRLRAVRTDGKAAIPWSAGLVARPMQDGVLTLNGHGYRGEVFVSGGDSDLLVVNRLPLELYLRSVVGREMGGRAREELAALQAQAVASRSFALTRLSASRTFDLRATTQDQAYGGVDSENDLATEAVRSTRGQALTFGGKVVDAPFSSACGGSSASPAEAWNTSGGGASYLLQVSDRTGSGDRLYCDIAPQFKWAHTFEAALLNAALDRYLSTYAAAGTGGNAGAAHPGAARVIAIRERTSTGRVSVLEVETDHGIYSVRGDNMRYVLREPGGEILRSTYFSVEPEYGRDGHVARVTVRGQGNGHGVGMCQWGAIGRARAGQSYRTILRTYYPGTTVGLAPAQ
jgi:stage II sporulation protein D